MKKILILILVLIFTQCSFDNKSGIWKNKNTLNTSKESRFKDFETLYTKEKIFASLIPAPKNLTIELDQIKNATSWLNELYQESNNLDNFSYTNLNKLIFKSKKLSKYNIKDQILFDGQNIVINDIKGNIIVYSIKRQEVIFKYNFYKKKFKKLKKNLNLIINNNVIYASDNIGYVYAINYKNKKLLWAINLKIPLRSNLKIIKDKLITSDQDNTIYILNKKNGNRLGLIPTEEITLKNEFINSLASDGRSFYYLNTYGSLYSVDEQDNRINWFINLNSSLSQNPGNLFYSNPLQIYNDRIIISTDPYLYVLNKINGSSILKISIISIVNPIISGQNLFLITKDNLLVCIDLKSGRIIYSLSISQEIAKFLNSKSKSIDVKDLSLLDNKLFVFLSNSYSIEFSVTGSLIDINKLPAKLNSSPIFIDGSIIYLNKQKKLIVVN